MFHDNGTIGIDAGATGIEAVKGVLAKTMHDPSAKEDTRYGTLIDHICRHHSPASITSASTSMWTARTTPVAMDPEVKPNTPAAAHQYYAGESVHD